MDEEGLTPLEKVRVNELIAQVDDTTKAMADEWFLAKFTNDWRGHSQLKEKWQEMNAELAVLLGKRGESL